MPLMMDADALRPYLDTVRATRAARLAVVAALKALPEPHTAQQIAANQRTYQAADRAHIEACAHLARQVEEAEGERAVACSPYA